MDREDHWVECETYNDVFFTQQSCNQHMNAKDHWASRFDCETCDQDFSSQEAANQHMNKKKHWARKIPCETCEKKFHDDEAAKRHMTSKKHWAPKISCETCERKFHDTKAVNQHMQDVGHWGCKTCNQKFQTENERKMVCLPNPTKTSQELLQPAFTINPRYSTLTLNLIAKAKSHALSASAISKAHLVFRIMSNQDPVRMLETSTAKRFMI